MTSWHGRQLEIPNIEMVIKLSHSVPIFIFIFIFIFAKRREEREDRNEGVCMLNE